ncbi:MAG TPA: hypothetical protein VGF56_01290 [Rhizomicrobium sp.]
MRTLVLGSAASLVVAFASPSFAQYAGNPPQVSTPAERQQTQQLNGQAADGTTATPSQLNGQGSMDAAPRNGAAADAQYQQDQAQYQQQQQQYQHDKSRYDREHARYNAQVRQYDVREYAWDYPHRHYAYRYGDSDRQIVRLYLLGDPQTQLHNVSIEGPNGEWVGRVRNIQTGEDQRPFRIEVSLNRRVSVWVPAGDFRFDATDGVLFTDLTRDQLWDMPGATVESNAYYAP